MPDRRRAQTADRERVRRRRADALPAAAKRNESALDPALVDESRGTLAPASNSGSDFSLIKLADLDHDRDIPKVAVRIERPRRAATDGGVVDIDRIGDHRRGRV